METPDEDDYPSLLEEGSSSKSTSKAAAEVVAAEVVDGEGGGLSALQHSIKKKGSNSYYYAHGSKATGPAWDGKEEPRLLEVSSIASSAAGSSSSACKVFTPITEYAWGDGANAVKLYVDFEGALLVDDGSISTCVENNGTQLDFSFVGSDGQNHKLLVGPLHAEVDTCTYKKKENSFILTMKKRHVASWYELKKKA